jgi:hypothetical protein
MTVYIPTRNFILHIGKAVAVEICGGERWVDNSRLVVSWAHYTVHRLPGPTL